MKIKSYCKINLSLRVLRKLNSNLHDIESNNVMVNVFDEIKLVKTNKTKDLVSFKGKFREFINPKKNTVVETLYLLRKFKLIKNFYKIEIKKNIPVFSGLGGGTGNSVSIIKHLLKKGLKKEFINFFENRIGSDFRILSINQSFQKRLKKVYPYKKKFKFWFILIFPNIKCSTRKIYSLVKKYNKPSRISFHTIKTKKKFINYLIKEKNDLQKISSKKYFGIKTLLDFISNQKGCIVSRMTGSGSACFGLFKTHKLAKLALKQANKSYPKHWCVVTKTI